MELYIYKAEVLRILDGDTIEILLDKGFNDFSKKTARLLFYDANETRNVKYKENNKALGIEQREWLRKELDKSPFIYIKSRKVDAFGRILAEAFDEKEESINAKFIEKWPQSAVK